MKKLINTVLLLFLIGTVSSCLKSGLDDLEAYNEAEITNLNFEYRWWDEAKDQMAVKTLNIEKQISKDDNLITCKLTVPTASGSFTDAVRQNVSLSNLIDCCRRYEKRVDNKDYGFCEIRITIEVIRITD